MSSSQPPAPGVSDSKRTQLLADLHELVDALDRRVPHPEREAEGAIARDSATMKREAEERIAQLQPPPGSPDTL